MRFSTFNFNFMRPNYRNSVLLFIFFFIMTPTVLIVFNYTMDPNHRYRFSVPSDVLSTLSQSNDKVLTVPPNYDDRALVKKFILASEPPQVVVIGGSRVLNVQDDFFVEPYRSHLLNTAVMAGTIRDYVAIWEIIESQGFKPQYVFICLEEQSMNTYSQNDRYLSIYEYYSAFFNQGASLRQQLMGLTTNLKDLLSMQTTGGSFAILMQQSESSWNLAPRENYDTTLHAKTQSFSMLYPAQNEQRTPKVVDPMGRANGYGEIKVFEMWNRGDRRGYDHLIALIRRIKRIGATPVMIGMPYHPEAYRLIQTSPKAVDNMLHFIDQLKQIAEDEGVFFYDAIEEHHNDFINADFLDGVHLKRPAEHALFYSVAQAADLEFITQPSPEESHRT